MKDLEKLSNPSYKDLALEYNKYFSIGKITSDINVKFALISLIGWIVYELQKKRPDITYYQIVKKLAVGTGLDDLDIYKIAIITEDFSYCCTDFPTFGISLKDAPKKIKEIMCNVMPF